MHLAPDGRRTPQHYYAFDLLWLDGRDLRHQPLIERKRLLRGLVEPPVLMAITSSRAVWINSRAHVSATGGHRCETAAGHYEPAATTWVKIKNPTYTQAEGRADFFDIGAARQSRRFILGQA